jgi:nitrite reductase (NO-forming)
MTRSRWHTATSALVLAWLTAAGVTAALHRQVPASGWLMVHLLLLGAVTTSILVWTQHFSVAVLHVRGSDSRRGEATRLIVANVGALAVIAGVVAGVPVLVAGGAFAVAVAVAAHVGSLVGHLRASLPSRFGVTVRTYVAAGALLIPGVALGVALARGDWDDATYDRLTLAHATLAVLGWVFLPIMGTLVTLWPTMLRTKLEPGAERRARIALPVLVLAILVVTTAAASGLDRLGAAGVATLLLGGWLMAEPMVATMRRRPPESFAAWSTLAGVTWLAVSLLGLGAAFVAGPVTVLSGSAAPLLGAALVGGVLQVLLGSLSYLLPVMIGGGPAAARARTARVDRGMSARLVLLNTSLVFCVLPSPSAVRVLCSTLVLVAVAWTGLALAEALRRLTDRPGSAGAPAPASPLPTRRTAGVVLALASTLLAVVGGVAYDPVAVGATAVSAEPAAAGVAATGRLTTVTVTIEGMRFTPDTVQVPAGDELVINVVNNGDDIHDLVLETGQRTARLSPGQRATLEVGVVGRALDGWCSVAGHRQMGMVLRVEVTGAPDASSTSHPTHTPADPDPGSAVGPVDLMAEPDPAMTPYDARLAAAPPTTVHRVQLVVSEVETEVAPGVSQTRWTFGGTSPGPTLRGRIGDEFVITLVNDGSIGHSIDFHAGALAPDRPMRTIAPGESLEYRFTATRAGIWMYHCSTMPMSMHIANGMFGAVVIDPPDLGSVDEEFVLVQSESYLGPQGGTADATAIASGNYTLVSFNGYPMQYDHHPLQVAAGDRVRIWVLAAGPNVGTSFHVVGGQFDTVYREGSYDLLPGAGGAQSLGLLPAQGGFVELEFAEPGNYPFVSHVMSDAEKGAHGTLHVVEGAP